MKSFLWFCCMGLANCQSARPSLDLTVASLGTASRSEILDRFSEMERIFNSAAPCDQAVSCSGPLIKLREPIRNYSWAYPSRIIRNWTTFSDYAQYLPINSWVVGGFSSDGCRKVGMEAGPRLPQGCANTGQGWFAIQADAVKPAWAHELAHAAGVSHRPEGTASEPCPTHPCNLMSCVVGDSNRGVNARECDSIRLRQPAFDAKRSATLLRTLIVKSTPGGSKIGQILADHAWSLVTVGSMPGNIKEAGYQIIIIHSVEQLTPDQIEQLVIWVNGGGRLVLLPQAIQKALETSPTGLFGLSGANTTRLPQTSRVRFNDPKHFRDRGIKVPETPVSRPWLSFSEYNTPDWLKPVVSISSQPVLMAGNQLPQHGKLLLIGFGSEQSEEEMESVGLLEIATAWLVGGASLYADISPIK